MIPFANSGRTIHQISARLASKFEESILQFVQQHHTRRVYVVSWNDNLSHLNIFTIEHRWMPFTFDDRSHAYSLARQIAKERGVYGVTVQIYDLKRLVNMRQCEIDSIRGCPNYQLIRSIWDDFHTCCNCHKVVPEVRECLWCGERRQICSDCMVIIAFNSGVKWKRYFPQF